MMFPSAKNARLSISDLVSSLQHSSAKKVLLVPFEDVDLIDALRGELPELDIVVLAKHDIAGKSVWYLISRLRERRWDAIIGSLNNSAVKRSQLSTEMLIGLGKAEARYLRTDDSLFLVISRSRKWIHLFPKLVKGCFLGMVLLLWMYGLVIRLQRKSNGRTAGPMKLGGTVLYLRTDLGGHLQTGGSVSHAKGMINAFVKSGFRVVYVADKRLETLPHEVVQIAVQPSTELEFLDEFQLMDFNRQLCRLGPKLVSEFRPCLLYQRHSVFNFSGGKIASQANIPIVLEANASEVWVREHWSRLVFPDLAGRCESLALRLSTSIAVISEGVKQQLAPYGIDEDKFLLNPNGVDPLEFGPAVSGKEIRNRLNLRNKVAVGFIGTFTRWHGVETLFDAAVISVKKNRKLCFIFMGNGDLRRELERRARELALHDRIIFTGSIPHSEVPRYLAACDTLVSPHLGFEDGTRFFGSPTKLFEYMAMGKAIIASDLEQIGETIVDGVNGLLMKPGDVNQLSDLVLKLAGNEGLRLTLGAQARKDVEGKYTWVSNVERIMRTLEPKAA
ncbi:MAG: glycosyltransferase family 4 protein [Bacteroidota bacterium]